MVVVLNGKIKGEERVSYKYGELNASL